MQKKYINSDSLDQNYQATSSSLYMAEKIVKSVFDSSSDSEGDSDCLQLHADDYNLDYEEGISDTVTDHGDINDNPDIDEHFQDYGSQGYDSDSRYLDTSPLVDVPATEENNSDGSGDTAPSA